MNWVPAVQSSQCHNHNNNYKMGLCHLDVSVSHLLLKYLLAHLLMASKDMFYIYQRPHFLVKIQALPEGFNYIFLQRFFLSLIRCLYFRPYKSLVVH